METLSLNSSVLTDKGAKRIVAVFLDEGEVVEVVRPGRSPGDHGNSWELMLQHQGFIKERVGKGSRSSSWSTTSFCRHTGQAMVSRHRVERPLDLDVVVFVDLWAHTTAAGRKRSQALGKLGQLIDREDSSNAS